MTHLIDTETETETELAATGAIESFMRLARRGAWAALSPAEGGGLLRIWTQKGQHVAPGHVLPRPHLEAGLTHGLLAEAEGRFRLTDAGRRLVRRAHSARVLERTGGAEAEPPTQVSPFNLAAINAAESPLAWLRRRKGKEGRPFLPDALFAAGERLRADLWRAQMTPRTTSSWSPVAGARGQSGGGGIEFTDAVFAARERVQRALKSVGVDHADLLIDVLGHLKGLEDVERTYGLPPRSAKLFLHRALTALARHYGYLEEVDVATHVRTRLQHWGAPGFRPQAGRAKIDPFPS